MPTEAEMQEVPVMSTLDTLKRILRNVITIRTAGGGGSGSAVSTGAGAVDATTTRVTIGTDDAVAAALAKDASVTALKASVDLTAQAGAGAVSATTQRVVAATDSPEVVSNAAIKTAVEAVAQAGAGAVSATTQRVVLATDDPAVAALASILAALSPSATQGGLDTILIGSLTNAAQAVKGTSGRLHGIHCVNNHTAIVYVQIFDLATGSVTLGTTVPKQSYAVPANGGILDLPLPDPITFGTAISVACTTTYNGSTAPGTTLIFNARYK